MGILPICANWMICNSNCSVNSRFTIFRFVSRCRASGDKICLSSASFWSSTSFSAWFCLCSSEARCWYAESFLRRIALSSSSDITYSPWYFLSSGMTLTMSLWRSWLISCIIFLPLGDITRPFGRVVCMSPAASSCCRILRMLLPPDLEAWFGLTLKPFRPP